MFLEATAINALRPLTPLPLPLFELYPSALAGSPHVVLTRPATPAGFADLLGVSIARMQEMFESILGAGDVRNQAVTAYALAYVGLLFKVGSKNAPLTNDEAMMKFTNELRSTGTHPDIVNQTTVAIAEAIAWSGALPDRLVSRRFAETALIQLDQSGQWFLAPYTYLAAPFLLTAEMLVSRRVTFSEGLGSGDDPRRWRRLLPSHPFLIPSRSIARIEGLDSRTVIPVSYPIGTYLSHPFALSMRSYTTGTAVRFAPVRLDRVDGIVSTGEDAVLPATEMRIMCRPGKTFHEIPEALAPDFALSAEGGLKL